MEALEALLSVSDGLTCVYSSLREDSCEHTGAQSGHLQRLCEMKGQKALTLEDAPLLGPASATAQTLKV